MTDECDVCKMSLDDAAIRVGDSRFCDAICREMAMEGDDDQRINTISGEGRLEQPSRFRRSNG